jgi:5-methylthioribose kinase
MELDVGNCEAYLRSMGVVPADTPVVVDVLAGGVSNIVLRATWPEGAVVVKQSLPQLRVDVRWDFDRARIFVERDCLQELETLLPGLAPQVVFSDQSEFAIGITLAPDGGEVWREQLERGIVDLPATRNAASALAHLQVRSAADAPRLSRRFEDQMPLIQGRVDPFHRRIAAQHPHLAEIINAEVTRMLGTRRALVHGDYSPKNVIVYPDRILLLDCEVAHWGDPAFDAAFLLCHLLLDGAQEPDFADVFASVAVEAWRTYRTQGGLADDASVIAELGCLLLARVDGKSPLAHLRGERATPVRAYATHLLLAGGLSVEDRVRESVEFLGAASQYAATQVQAPDSRGSTR